jgi:hypothetical protein
MAFGAGTLAIITVLIYNPAAVPERTLARAEKTATAILTTAGVSLIWRSARAEDADPRPAEIALHLLPGRPPRLHADAAGFAVLRQDPAGESYAGISYPAVVDTANWTDGEVPVVLGAALAHEIGHVLLASGSHSAAGVMSARLRAPEVFAASRGELRFTPREAARIQKEAMRRTLAVIR